jgi:hypothetical protein
MTLNRSPGISGLFAVAAFLVMLVPRSAQAQTGFPDARTLCYPADVQRNKPTETSCFRQFHDVAERNDDVLTLKLDNGKTKVFKSNTAACENGPDDCVEYRLVGYIASDRQFIVQALYYESGFVNLVSRRNGEVTELEDWPHPSPNNKRFVVIAASEAWEIENAVAIFSATTDPPKLLWKYPTPKEYELYAFDVWDGEGRILVRVINKDDMTTDLKLTPQGWQLKRPNGEVSPGVSVTPPSATPAKPPVVPAH